MDKENLFIFEIIRNSLLNITKEMKVVVMKSAYSTLWRESGDLSCAILNRNAELVAQGPDDIPVHLASMPFSLKGALDKIGMGNLEPGDVLFHNDPRWGNNHLPDCMMAKPIFWDNEIIAFGAVRGHWTDIGGMSPGSYTTITNESIQEGLCIPPCKIYKKNTLDKELIDLIMANVRCPEERIGDLRSQYAGCMAAEHRIKALVSKYGRETALWCLKKVLDDSEQSTRAEIEKIPDGSYQFEDYCDGDGVTDELIQIKVNVIVNGSNITVDFTGTHKQTVGGMNAPYAVTASSTYFAIKAVTDPWAPCNSGSYRPVGIVAPKGSVVNPMFPAPVIAGNHETGNIIVDVIFGALFKARPSRVIAAGAGSAGAVTFGGIDSRPGKEGKRFVYNEPHGGSWGARFAQDGINAIRVGVGNTGNQPVEVVEMEYPIMIEKYEIVKDTGGAGKFRGGLPMCRVYKVMNDCILTVTGERSRVAPFGLNGGKAGEYARYILNPGKDSERILFSKTLPIHLSKGTVFYAQVAGGGGFGNPSDREKTRVYMDVLNEYVSIEKAKEEYNLNITSDQMQIAKKKIDQLMNKEE